MPTLHAHPDDHAALQAQGTDSQYFLFDGRWFEDQDASLVLCTADTIEEALDDYELFPDDTVIVDSHGIAVYCKEIGLSLTR